MERPEFNKLRKVAKSDPELVVEEGQNWMRASLYDGGDIISMAVVTKADVYKQAETRLLRLLEKSKQLKSNKNNVI